MVFDYFTTPMGIASIIGFVVGSFGYVVGMMIIRPVFRYRRLKKAVEKALDDIDGNNGVPEGEPLRRVASALSTCYTEVLPIWYKTALHGRKESPLDAVGHLMTLADTKNPVHAQKRILAIRNALQMNPSSTP